MCEADGRVVAATVADHIRPHRGDRSLFWNPENLQPLCVHCHSSIKQRIESGRTQAIDVDGWPIT
jgi:5-methylcytosine-specific restriction endonuclease McrA